MSKKLKQAGILLGILILPSLFYVVLSTGDHNIGRASFFGPKKPHPTEKIKRDIPDTIYYAVPNYTFKDLNGNSKRFSDIGDQITVVHFFCTSCYDENYRVLEQMGKLHERFKDKPQVTLLSVLMDSISISEIEEVQKAYPIGKEKWKLWSPSLTWKELAQEGFLLETEYAPYSANPNVLVLLDGKRRIRGYYDGKQYVETNALMDAIKALRFSYYRSVKNEDNEQR